MSKRKPKVKAKRPRYPSRDEVALSTPERIARKMLAVERHYERMAREWTARGIALTPERLRTIKDIAAKRTLERDHETFNPGPRAVPDSCRRSAVLPISRAADILGVEGKSDRFIARFITTGIIAANKEGRQSWKFDLDELERVALELEDEARAARKRRAL